MLVINTELYSSKNSRQVFKIGNKTIVSKSTVAKRQEKDLCKLLPLYRNKFLSMLESHEKPYKVHFKIYRRTKGRFDYINIIQNLCDCMVKSGLLEDDDANNLLPVFEQYEVDPKNPRVEIFL